jgi:hypothetical protein
MVWVKESLRLNRILTNCVAYRDILTNIKEQDWDVLCAMDAFDHIYVGSVTIGSHKCYDIRVSKGPWRVDL